VANPLHARYLEMITPSWLLGAFVCQTRTLTLCLLILRPVILCFFALTGTDVCPSPTERDRDTFLQEVYDKQKLKITSTFRAAVYARVSLSFTLADNHAFGVQRSSPSPTIRASTPTCVLSTA
jgi:hypothetical protein